MKLASVLCALALGVSTIGAPGPGPQSPIGRYQLFAAQVNYVTDQGSSATPRLFRIDTATGKTCEFVQATLAQGKIDGWVQIAEPTDHSATVEFIRLSFFNEWFQENPDGGLCPLEDPPLRLTKQEAQEYQAALRARVKFLTQIQSLRQPATNPPARKP